MGNNSIKRVTIMSLIAWMTMIQANSVLAAPNEQSPALLLDGKPLQLPVQPVIENGVSYVPLRPIFEAQGAKVSWDEPNHTVTATKDSSLITYQMGDKFAYKNNEKLTLPAPGKVINGSSMVPLRFISELLGNVVQWHAYSQTITISSADSFETEITYGANLRTLPNATDEKSVIRMLPKGQRIHVIREIDANWLEVQTADKTIGFISAKPKYTTYTSPSLTMKQADQIIAFGSTYFGTHYEFGADPGQTDTFDCSSFVKHVFNQVLSVDLPRLSYDQAKEGKEIKVEDLRKGDLMFFSARGLDIGHVGIYAGDGKILHTYSDKLGVHIEDFDGQWKDRFVTARRVF
ncbi:stalk domain-containing protein [Paenibacillus lignilyticus]|nr:stalk domain-containing protein [Paenibacillus lignilyticus]